MSSHAGKREAAAQGNLGEGSDGGDARTRALAGSASQLGQDDAPWGPLRVQS